MTWSPCVDLPIHALYLFITRKKVLIVFIDIIMIHIVLIFSLMHTMHIYIF